MVQLGPYAGVTCSKAGSSLPQGDPASPLALVLFLNSAATDVARLGIRQSLSLDDRVLVASTVPRLLAGWRRWGWWSRHLGLRENQSKCVALAPTIHHRYALLRVGFREDQIRAQLRVLGIDFVASGQGNGGDTSLKKFHVSKLLAAPLARANVGVDVRRKLFATRTIPKVSFGWWLLPFQDRQRSAFFQLYRLVGAVQRQSAVGLRPILDGHAKCPQFRAVAQAVTELGTAARAGLTWSQPLNAWASTVSSQLTRWGFRLEGALEVAAFFGSLGCETRQGSCLTHPEGGLDGLELAVLSDRRPP